MGMPGTTRTTLVALCTGLLVLGGCSTGEPQPRPTIGSPSPTSTPSATTFDRSLELAREWELTGALLPADWPDVPLPRGAEVVTAYAIGSPPRRTWTATFTTDSGTALDMAEPIVAALRIRQYVPIAEYVGAAETNTGLYSFSAPTFSVYVVLGEDDGQPNLVLTVRGSTGRPGSASPSRQPTGTPSPTSTAPPTRSLSPTDTASAQPDVSAPQAQSPSGTATPDG